MPVPESAWTLGESQHGLATRAQLRAAGMTPGAIRWQLDRHWRMVLPEVVCLHRQPPTQVQRQMAALLFTGDDAVISGAHALVGSGLRAEPEVGAIVHLLVPRGRHGGRSGWVYRHRTCVIGGQVQRDGLRLASPARALIDTATWMPQAGGVRALIIDAVQRRIVRVSDCEHWLALASTRRRAVIRSALDEAAGHAWSVPEADLAALLGTSRVLPVPWANPHLIDQAGTVLTSPDLWLDDVALAIMVHSRAHHTEGDDFDATLRADSCLQAAGVRVIAVTPRQVTHDPRWVLATIEQAYARALAAGGRREVTARRRTVA